MSEARIRMRLRSRAWSWLERVGLAPSPPEGRLFHGFISYSHAADGKLAPALQKGLQRFARRWYRARALHVFRDQASMAVTPNLWKEIEQALDASDYYILLASPEAQRSEWVSREAERWRQTKPPEHLLLALTGGNIVWDSSAKDFDWERTDAVPKVLQGAFDDQPLWVDLRWAREETDLSLDHARFRDAVAGLAAGLHGKPKDQLESQEVVEQRRAVRIRRVAAAALMILTTAALVAMGLALHERSTAISNQKTAQSRQLAASAEGALASDPELSTLLSMRALQVRYTTQAESALRDSLPLLQIRRRLKPYVPITQLAVSRDGSRFVALISDQTFELCSTVGPRCVKELSVSDDSNPMTTAAFSPDGSEIVAIDAAGGAFSFNPDTGKSRFLFGIWSGRTSVGANSVSFDESGKRLVTANTNGTATVWSAQGNQIRLITEPAHAAVNNAAFARDDRIVTASSDGTARIWDAASGRPLVVLSEPRHAAITSVEFSPDGGRVVTGSSDGTARIWDAASGRQLAVLSEPGRAAVTRAHFRPDGLRVITASDDGSARIWDAYSGRQLTVNQQAVPSILCDAVFVPGGAAVLTAGHAGFVTLWNGTSGRTTGSTTAAGDLPLGAAYSADGRLIVTDGTSTAQVWDAQTGRQVTALGPADGGNVIGANFDASGRRVVMAFTNGAFANDVQVWSVDTGRRVLTLHGPDSISGAADAAFSPDGREIVAVETDGTAPVWNASNGALVRTLGRRGGPQLDSASFTPDSRHVLTVRGATAHVWDVATGGTQSTSTAPVAGSSASPDGVHVVTSAADGTVWVWDGASGRQLARIIEPAGGAPRSESFNHSGRLMATDGEDGVARVWDLATGRQVSAVIDPVGLGVPFVSISPDGTGLVTQSGSVWDVLPRELMKTVAAASGSAVLSPDRQRVLTTAAGSAQLWDVASGRQLRTLHEPGGAVASAVFNSDGSRILTAGSDGVARLWSAATGTGQGMFVMPKHKAVADAVFSPDGTRVLTASSDGLARLWKIGAREPPTVFGKDMPVTMPNPTVSVPAVPTPSSVLPTSTNGLTDTTGAQTQTISLPANPPNPLSGVAFTPDGKYFVAFDVDGGINVYSVGDTAAPVAVLDTGAQRATITSAGFDAGGDLVASVTNGNAYVWYNVVARADQQGLGAPDRVLSPGTGPLVNASFSPDGKRVLTGGADGTARVWDARTGAQMTQFKLATPLTSAAYSRDGSEAVLSAGSVTIWSTELADRLRTLERIAMERITRTLTSSEQAKYLAGIGG